MLIALFGAILGIAGTVIAVFLAVARGFFVDELRGRIERLPTGLLGLAARQLPADQRDAILKDEWVPELIFILRKAEGLPITRLILGVRFALSMIRGAYRVGRTLKRPAALDERKPRRITITGWSGRWLRADPEKLKVVLEFKTTSNVAVVEQVNPVWLRDLSPKRGSDEPGRPQGRPPIG